MQKILASLLILAFTSGALAADLPQPAGKPADIAALTRVVTEDALLYQLRAAFDVVPSDRLAQQISDDANSLSRTQYLDDRERYILDDLLAEGSYYIVSLKYLIEAGAPNWPSDRSSSVYQQDALVKLDALQARWISATEVAGDDLRAILLEVDAINAWTEGQATATGSLAHFENTDELVRAALSGAGQ